MKTTVHIQSRHSAIVRQQPSWFRRLLGAEPSERFAVMRPAPGGHLSWHWSESGRAVSHAVERAIQDEIIRLEWVRLWNAIGQ